MGPIVSPPAARSATVTAPRFAIATRDELWSGGTRLESRLSHGEAQQQGRELRARDTRDHELVTACDALAASVVLDGIEGRLRVVASAKRVGDTRVDSVTLTVTRGALSIVTTPEHLREDLSLLVRPAATPMSREIPRSTPILWRNGSAAVLLHEAAGHAAEHEHPPLEWPTWLTVHDEPHAPIDDCGERARIADLLREPPASHRRESFRDVPLRRMSNLVARQQGAPFVLPETRIEIHLLAGGVYEPLTETISLFVTAADFVDASGIHPLPPFEIRESRAAVAAAIAGATGDPLRYPGVICSSEGQDLVAGSHAPLLLTVFR
ncbi:MAG TPA: hypothetical protein VGF69_13605 [Thermoanaerobaculia bacterium]|jgi:hypothetical protein